GMSPIPHPSPSGSPGASASAAPQSPAAGELGRATWTLIELGGQPVPAPSGALAPGLRFDVTQKRVSGSTGCNSLSGTYTADASALHFSPLAVTRMACLDPARQARESAFLAVLERVTAYRIDGPTLTLYAAEAPLAVFHGASQEE